MLEWNAPNKSFDRSENSLAFIHKTWMLDASYVDRLNFGVSVSRILTSRQIVMSDPPLTSNPFL